MIATILLFVTAALTLAWAAFCSGTETGFLSVSRERVLHLAREGGRKAKILEAALRNMSRTTTTLLIGNNLANVIYSSAVAALSTRLLADSATATAIWTFLTAFAMLYLSEFLPKLMMAARPLRRTLAAARAYRIMAVALSPFTFLALKLTNLFMPVRDPKYRLTGADLLRILQDRKDGVCLTDIESALISRLIVLRTKHRPITAEELLDALREDEPPADSPQRRKSSTTESPGSAP